MVRSEQGCTPLVSNKLGGGLLHWGSTDTGRYAGTGIPQGQVVGTTDREGGSPTDRPIQPKDILATVSCLLGIDHNRTTYQDAAGCSHTLLPSDDVIPEWIGSWCA